MYTADALARELNRALSRTVFHSICVTGRDALGNPEFLAAAFRQLSPACDIMVDTDGQRPESLAVMQPFLKLVQVTVEPPATATVLERGMETIRTAARTNCMHAVVIAGTDEASDADYLQIVEQTHDASNAAAIVIHPGPGAERGALDKRWSVLMEHASARHRDVRLLPRLNGPSTMR